MDELTVRETHENDFDGVVVFSATKARDRECLGERVTSWIEEHEGGIYIVDKVVTQSSDNEFHCIAITIFYRVAS